MRQRELSRDDISFEISKPTLNDTTGYQTSNKAIPFTLSQRVFSLWGLRISIHKCIGSHSHHGHHIPSNEQTVREGILRPHLFCGGKNIIKVNEVRCLSPIQSTKTDPCTLALFNHTQDGIGVPEV